MKKFLLLPLFALMLVSNSFAGDTELSHQSCFSGSRAERLTFAAQIFSSLTLNSETLTPDMPLGSLALRDTTSTIYQQLGAKVDSLGCGFTTSARFDTVEDAIYALGLHANLVRQLADNSPTWLKPGFKAVIAGNDNPRGRIFIKTTEDGFKFYACEPDPVSGVMPHVGDSCTPLMDDTFVVPIEKLLKAEQGPKHAILLVLKTVAQVSVVFTSNLGLNFLSPIAQTLSTTIDPNPLSVMQRDHRIGGAVQDIFTLGGLNPNSTDQANFLITRRLPYKYADLKQGLQDVLGQIDAQEYRQLERYSRNPHNPSARNTPEYRQQLNFHNEMLQDYQAGQAAATETTPTPTPVPAANH